ncbi:MAG: hypothetical protein KDK54_19615 [Leptospiraceae bacterium]|nr:hypothetical protein [Leptospiraceae bacterium]
MKLQLNEESIDLLNGTPSPNARYYIYYKYTKTLKKPGYRGELHNPTYKRISYPVYTADGKTVTHDKTLPGRVIQFLQRYNPGLTIVKAIVSKSVPTSTTTNTPVKVPTTSTTPNVWENVVNPTVTPVKVPTTSTTTNTPVKVPTTSTTPNVWENVVNPTVTPVKVPTTSTTTNTPVKVPTVSTTVSNVVKENKDPYQAKDNTLLYVGAGLLSLGMIGFVLMDSNKGKKKKRKR